MKHGKTKQRMQTVDDSTYTCDVPECGKPASRTDSKRSCCMCSGDFCSKHRLRDPRDDGDYPSVFCTVCWGIGEPHRKTMDMAEEVYDDVVEDAEQEWKKACYEWRHAVG